MKTTTIGVYENHEKAIAAVKELKENGFSDKQLSIIWKQEEIEKQSDKISNTGAAEVGIGVTAGGVLGVLTGIGVFAIPGLGFLFGAGAIVGAIAGIDFGLISGGLIGALSFLSIKKEHHEKYDKYIKEGRYLVLIEGGKKETEKAHEILNSHSQHIDLDIHGAKIE